jgi:hypothetical protein
MRILHRLMFWQWRLAIVLGVSFVIVATTAFLDARDQQLRAIGRAAEWTPERTAVREAGRTESVGECLSRASSEFGRFLCENPDVIRDLPAAPEEPKQILEYVAADAGPLLLWFIGSTTVLFILLSVGAMHRREQSVGWRRLSVIAASAASIGVFGITLLGRSRMNDETDDAIGVLLSLAAFPAVMFLLLSGKVIARWVQDGFLQDRGQSATFVQGHRTNAPVEEQRDTRETTTTARAENAAESRKGLRAKPSGVGGWLAFLIFALLLGALIMFVNTHYHFADLAEHYPVDANTPEWRAYRVLTELIVAAAAMLHFVAGYRLWTVHTPATVRLAKLVLCLTTPSLFFAQLFVAGVTLGDFTATAEDVGRVIGVYLAAGVWFVYLKRSKRVWNTYYGGGECEERNPFSA